MPCGSRAVYPADLVHGVAVTGTAVRVAKTMSTNMVAHEVNLMTKTVDVVVSLVRDQTMMMFDSRSVRSAGASSSKSEEMVSREKHR